MPTDPLLRARELLDQRDRVAAAGVGYADRQLADALRDVLAHVDHLTSEARADGERLGIGRAADVVEAIPSARVTRTVTASKIRALAVRPPLGPAPKPVPPILGPWGTVDDGLGRPGVAGDVRCMRFGVASHINGGPSAGVGLYATDGRLLASRTLNELDAAGWPREAMADEWAASLGCAFTDGPTAATRRGGDRG